MKKIFFLIFIVITIPLYAQKQGQPLIDSLLQELPKAKDDTNKVNILDKLSSEYRNINPDEGIKYGQQGLALAAKLDWKKGTGWAYNNLANNYQHKSDYPKAFEYFFKALKVFEEIGYKQGVAGITMGIGLVYSKQGDYSKALEYYFKALKMQEEIGNKQGIANATGNIGDIYNVLSDYPKALEYDFKALKMFEETGNKSGVTIATGSIGQIYQSLSDYPKALEYAFKALRMDQETGNKHGIARFSVNIGTIYWYEGDYPKALEYYFKGLKIAEEIGNKQGMGSANGDIGLVYASQKNYTMAIEYFQKGLKINEEIGDKRNAANELSNIGEAYLSIASDTTAKTLNVADAPEITGKKYGFTRELPVEKKALLHNAIDYLQRSLALSKELHIMDVMQEAYGNLVDAYRLTGDYKKAMEVADNYHAIKDSVFSKESKIQITNLETRRDLDLKDKDIQIRNKEIEIARLAVAKKHNERGFFIAGILAIIIIVALFFRNYRRLSDQKNEFEKLRAVSNERVRIASEMHDELGSGLTSIRMLSEIAGGKIDHNIIPKSEIEKIERSASNLSENLREIIWTMNTRFDKLADFIVYTRSYAVEYFVDSPVSFQFYRPQIIPEITLNGELRRNLFLCIKEALNNILKHSQATEASLTFTIIGNSFVTEIKDNGTGFDINQTNKFGNGLNTMKERLNKFGSDLEIEVNGGTKLFFRVPV